MSLLEDGADQVSSAWWAGAFDAVQDEFEQVEILSSSFRTMSKAADLGDLERQVLEALAIATSALLEPDRHRIPTSLLPNWTAGGLRFRGI